VIKKGSNEGGRLSHSVEDSQARDASLLFDESLMVIDDDSCAYLCRMRMLQDSIVRRITHVRHGRRRRCFRLRPS
jgi:hypothetical protein